MFNLYNTIYIVGLGCFIYNILSVIDFKGLIINISYESIKIFSKCQIQYNKYFKPINKGIAYQVELVSNKGDIIKKIYTRDIDNIKKETQVEHDFVVVINYKYEKTYYIFIDKLRHNNLDILTNNKISSLKECNFRFMSFELDTGTKKYDIKLNFDKTTFYIVGNVINKEFLLYYIKNIIKDKNVDSLDKYNICLMDQNVDIKYLTQENQILLFEDQYNIL
jgi:hypothetical protein